MGDEVPFAVTKANQITSDRSAAWVKGFHGVVGSQALLENTSCSLRELAMSRRSTGFGRISVLTELPSPRTATAIFEKMPMAGEDADATDSLEEYLDLRMAEAPFFYLPNRSRSYAVTKRAIDLVGAGVLALLTFPVMVVLAMVICLDSPGPAIFRQTRVTRGGRTFTFLKFRTMYIDARERFPELYRRDLAEDAGERTYYKLPDDPRNTRVGRWLRRTTLDELPNLFNVLAGDLSLVGPRPDLPELVRQYRPEELTCLLTRAGVTGLAQVAGRSLLTIRERLTLDTRYVAQQTLLLDLRILWRTVVVVLLGRGAF